MTAARPETAGPRPGSVHRTFDILEVVAALGGASAKEIADATGLPLPTVYRLVRELLDGEYLVHIRERSEEHTSELQSRQYLVCRLLLEKNKIRSCKDI